MLRATARTVPTSKRRQLVTHAVRFGTVFPAHPWLARALGVLASVSVPMRAIAPGARQPVAPGRSRFSMVSPSASSITVDESLLDYDVAVATSGAEAAEVELPFWPAPDPLQGLARSTGETATVIADGIAEGAIAA